MAKVLPGDGLSSTLEWIIGVIVENNFSNVDQSRGRQERRPLVSCIRLLLWEYIQAHASTHAVIHSDLEPIPRRSQGPVPSSFYSSSMLVGQKLADGVQLEVVRFVLSEGGSNWFSFFIESLKTKDMSHLVLA